MISNSGEIKSVDLFLFDWDGCLANTLHIWVEAWEATFSSFGVDISRKQIIADAFGNWLAPQEMGIENTDLFAAELYQEVAKRLIRAELHKGAKEILEMLKLQGKKIALVTSSHLSVVEPVLSRYEIDSLFDVKLGEAEVTKHKPDPEVINLALRTTGSDRARAIMIGDSVKDVEAAKNSAVKSCVFYPKVNQAFYKSETVAEWNADFLISEFQELTQFI